MAELKRTGLELRAERGVLVQVISWRDRKYDHDETFDELEQLSRTAGVNVVGQMRQKRRMPHPKYYLGKGKLTELAQLCEKVDADVVVTDDELSVNQVKTLEERLDRKVVDRSEIILDIFAAHARTKQAKLQVELAQLEYEFPRLKRMWTHLDRTAGGTLGGPAGGGVGVRGPGEKQLEVDRRLVQRRIYDLRQELEGIRKQHQVTVDSRGGQFPTVALVGYTNAGKSSLMNALTGADVKVRDRLFETLDTRTRMWEPEEGIQILLSDTVGFVRKFPHHLAESFQTTLSEAVEADLLLHVIDASQENSEQEIEAVNEALADIECQDKPTVYVLNKIDRIEGVSDLGLLQGLVGDGDVVSTSTVTGQGLDELADLVKDKLDVRNAELIVRAPVGDGRLYAWLHEHGEVLDEQYENADMALTVRMPDDLVWAVRDMGGEVERTGERA
jgi:GTP-binding protein HflX